MSSSTNRHPFLNFVSTATSSPQGVEMVNIFMSYEACFQAETTLRVAIHKPQFYSGKRGTT